MGKKSRDKGLRFEQELVNLARDAGLTAERVPLSGAAQGSFSGDVIIDGHRFEAKIRADGFRELYKWLGTHRGVFVRSDRNESLIVIRAKDFLALLGE